MIAGGLVVSQRLGASVVAISTEGRKLENVIALMVMSLIAVFHPPLKKVQRPQNLRRYQIPHVGGPAVNPLIGVFVAVINMTGKKLENAPAMEVTSFVVVPKRKPQQRKPQIPAGGPGARKTNGLFGDASSTKNMNTAIGLVKMVWNTIVVTAHRLRITKWMKRSNVGGRRVLLQTRLRLTVRLVSISEVFKTAVAEKRYSNAAAPFLNLPEKIKPC